MSKQLISNYYNQLHKYKQYGGSYNEMAIRNPFMALVNAYAERRDLLLVPEIGVAGKKGNTVYPDGVLKNAMRLEFGFWESKDGKDDLDREIHKKLYEDGYPDRNILFEDTKTAVLVQEGAEVMRVTMEEAAQLDAILTRFLGYEPSIVKEFNQALAQFTQDVPGIVEDLRGLLEQQADANQDFIAKRDAFHESARSEINPAITAEDVREMIIQHILTEDIFNNVFGNANFHHYNNIARELEGVTNSFMTYGVRQNYLADIKHYYETINANAARIADHHEKQKFLKVIYENFYKVYNPKGADRLGVVYTPNEIVRFMIESADWLLEKHFGKNLGDKNVEILDPATGTGTFIAELIEYLNPHDLPYKYAHEIHANEVAILPYYIANLNIEYTYQQKMKAYAEFKNICFVDTLDNIDALHYAGKQDLLFGLSSENAERVKRQNEKRISVVIGNPPYYANQKNFNDFNANRKYPQIDKRIKETYVRYSTAQKTKAYDPYVRFIRWASDRVDENGIIAFVSNNSFIDGKSFDGLRKCLYEEFNEVYVVDLKGNANTSGERRKIEAGNIFDDKIKVGVAIYFLIKNKHKKGCRIYYKAIENYAKAWVKIDFIRNNDIEKISFEKLKPSHQNNWINLGDMENDFNHLLPLIDKDVKLGRAEDAIFKLFSLGVVTARDEWVCDYNKNTLSEKVDFLINSYNKDLKTFKGKSKAKIKEEIGKNDERKIKWSRAVINDIASGKEYVFDEDKIIESTYRPFLNKPMYFAKELNEMQYQMPKVFSGDNLVIAFSGEGSSKPFQVLAQNKIYNHDLLEKTQCLPLYTYDSENHRLDNITDWALQQFREHYGTKAETRTLVSVSEASVSPTEVENHTLTNVRVSASNESAQITKQGIFHYVYGVLHCPQYRQKYEQNLKREFPRLPFYADFAQWRDWGAALMDLHLNYETAEPYPLVRKDEGERIKGKARGWMIPRCSPTPHFSPPRPVLS